MNYSDALVADGRLCILKELGLQVDGRANEIALVRVLDAFGIRRTRDWVRTQLRAMEELGAIKTTETGTVMVAEIRKLGRYHLDRRAVVEGIARPSDED